jgi:hypothetical protein
MEKTTFAADTCSTCRFVGSHDFGAGLLSVCRKNPPVMANGWMPNGQGGAQLLTQPVWPIVNPLTDFCGARERRMDS